MPTEIADPTSDQPQSADEILRNREANRKCDEIRALLPGLKRTVEAFGELHELLDEHEIAGDFDTWCRHEFGVIPELLLDATECL